MIPLLGPFSMPDTYLSAILSGLVLAVTSIVGWLLRRAISAQDKNISTIVDKTNEVAKAVSQLQLLIVGDYAPRKELNLLSETFLHNMDQMRDNIHNLRDKYQDIASRLALLEGKLTQQGKL